MANILEPKQVITNGVMTGTAIISSTVVDCRMLVQTGFQFWWSGTPNGTFSVQASKNYNPLDPSNPAQQWTDTGFEIDPAVGVAEPASPGLVGGRLANIQTGSYSYLRFAYTNTSGVGSLQVWVDGKGPA